MTTLVKILIGMVIGFFGDLTVSDESSESLTAGTNVDVQEKTYFLFPAEKTDKIYACFHMQEVKF